MKLPPAPFWFFTNLNAEGEQSVLRLLLSSLVLIYLIVVDRNLFNTSIPITITIFYIFVAAIVHVWIILDKKIRPARHVTMSLLDICVIAIPLYFIGPLAFYFIILFPLISILDGFQFGAKYLLLSMSFSFAVFSFIAHSEEFWIQYKFITVGVYSIIGLIPIFMLTLINRLSAAVNNEIIANRAKSDFLANMSHELRTPLVGVIAYADLMENENSEEKQKKYLAGIRDCTTYLTDLISDILDISKIETGKMDIVDIETNIQSLFEEVRAVNKYKAKEKGVSIASTIDRDVPLIVVTDPTHLKQVLNNLVSNSVKFTNSGTIDIQVSMHEKKAGSFSLLFKVVDTGIGINESFKPHIFKKFQKHNPDAPGTGLGTAIALNIVKMHSGKIWFDTEEGKGTTFSFLWPCRPSPGFKIIKHVESVADVKSMKPLNILLAEDNHTNALVISEVLEMAGHTITIVNNGKECLDVLDEKLTEYDMVIADLYMPVMNGLALLENMHGRDSYDYPPVVILSATSTKTAINDCLANGAIDFISKPISAEPLIQKINHLSMRIKARDI